MGWWTVVSKGSVPLIPAVVKTDDRNILWNDQTCIMQCLKAPMVESSLLPINRGERLPVVDNILHGRVTI